MQRRYDWPMGRVQTIVQLTDELVELLDREAARRGVTFTPGGAVTAERRSQTSFRLSFSMVEPEELDEGVRRVARAITAGISCGQRHTSATKRASSKEDSFVCRSCSSARCTDSSNATSSLAPTCGARSGSASPPPTWPGT